MGHEFTEDDFLYPDTDCTPEADGDLHRRVVADILARLQARYADRPDVYVSGSLRVYWETWNPYAVVVPDCFVAFGVPKGDREEYRGWQEPSLPQVFIEVVSARGVMEDESKPRTYAEEFKATEVFLFDPTGRRLKLHLEGFRMRAGRLHPLPLVDGALVSETLGLTLTADGERLRLTDTTTGGEVLPAAEAEVARLRAELARLRGGN
jgi:Uma2 family endonuclease